MTAAAGTTHLVLGFDRSRASHTAIQVAADLALRLAAELHVVHVVDLSDYPVDPDLPTWEDLGRSVLASEEAEVRTALAGHAGPWSYRAMRGDPVALLASVADEVDALLVIVGTRGAGPSAALHRLLDGSVSHGLIGRHRPVLVVPTH
jgi:nucleotide-binding universal stress UspA family protein